LYATLSCFYHGQHLLYKHESPKDAFSLLYRRQQNGRQMLQSLKLEALASLRSSGSQQVYVLSLSWLLTFSLWLFKMYALLTQVYRLNKLGCLFWYDCYVAHLNVIGKYFDHKTFMHRHATFWLPSSPPLTFHFRLPSLGISPKAGTPNPSASAPAPAANPAPAAPAAAAAPTSNRSPARGDSNGASSSSSTSTSYLAPFVRQYGEAFTKARNEFLDRCGLAFYH
jgi:hypothetical protein